MRYVLAVALILVTAVGLAWYRSSAIKADLVDAVEAALVAADAEDVLVSVDGMEVTLAGEVADSATKERIDRAVAQLPKISRFVNAVEVASDGSRQSPAAADQSAVAESQAEFPTEVATESQTEAVTEAKTDTDDAVAAVSSQACQANLDALLEVGSIDFESSSAELDPSSLPLLDDLVVVVIQCGEARIEIAGHTDASGPREENLELSLRRAEAVKAHMLAAGVASDRLIAIGYGPDQPLVDNATPEGRARNRRIELRVLSP